MQKILEDIHSDFYPNDSDQAWPEPLSILTTNKLFKHPIMRIDGDRTNSIQIAALAGFYFAFRVPDDYDSGTAPIIRVRWVTSKTTGDVRWYCSLAAVANTGESVDPAAATETVEATVTTAGTAWTITETDLTFTGSNFAAGDEVQVFLANDGTNGADTLAGARIILRADFVYDDGA